MQNTILFILQWIWIFRNQIQYFRKDLQSNIYLRTRVTHKYLSKSPCKTWSRGPKTVSLATIHQQLDLLSPDTVGKWTLSHVDKPDNNSCRWLACDAGKLSVLSIRNIHHRSSLLDCIPPGPRLNTCRLWWHVCRSMVRSSLVVWIECKQRSWNWSQAQVRSLDDGVTTRWWRKVAHLSRLMSLISNMQRFGAWRSTETNQMSNHAWCYAQGYISG